MHNTNNWASSNAGSQEHWWISVNHDKENHKVHFHFVDYGQGILRSLERRSNPKIWSNFWNLLQNMVESNRKPEIIKSLLNGEHRTPEQRDHPYFRGKGLPSIRDALDRGQISNLQIITNDTYSDVQANKFISLSRDFNGTFVHWELEENNISEVWKT